MVSITGVRGKLLGKQTRLDKHIFWSLTTVRDKHAFTNTFFSYYTTHGRDRQTWIIILFSVLYILRDKDAKIRTFLGCYSLCEGQQYSKTKGGASISELLVFIDA